MKILMLGKPGGTLARTYDWHIEALNSDDKKRFDVDCIHDLNGNVVITKYDVFWFYAKAFPSELYYKVKELRPDAKIVCGPNIMLDKPDVGLSDDWDKWYASECRPDIHLDQVMFYSDHVKKFLPEELKSVAKTLDKCIKLDKNLYSNTSKKEYDVLLYSKKRRYDSKFEDFRFDLISLLDESDIKYCEVPAGKFGSYERKDYFNLLNKSKFMVNLSLDECPGILNYESMFCDVPVIGSEHNVPVNSDKNLQVENTDYMTENYLVRTDDAAKKYFEKVKEKLLKDYKPSISPRDFVLEHTNFQKYCDNVEELLSL